MTDQAAIPLRLLVCGSRTLCDGTALRAFLTGLQPTAVIHGGARGADTLADDWAEDYDVPTRCFPAEWDKHGKAAGAIRNRQMLTEGTPDMVVAFVDKPLAESRGTADMVRQAIRAGIPVHVVHALIPAPTTQHKPSTQERTDG